MEIADRMQVYGQQKGRWVERVRRNMKSRMPIAKQEQLGVQGQVKLKNILNAFRQNNVKLMQKIEQSERVRTINESVLAKRKLIQKYKSQKVERFDHADTSRPQTYTQVRSQRRPESIPHRSYKKQNVNNMEHHEQHPGLSTNLIRSEQLIDEINAEEKGVRLVRISMNRLVPLSMDKLKEKFKML